MWIRAFPDTWGPRCTILQLPKLWLWWKLHVFSIMCTEHVCILCFEECFEEFSAVVWLFLCRLGIWIHRVLCHVIHSICLWKCFGFVSFSKSNIEAGFSKAGFLQVFKAMDCFQMCQWGVSIEEAEVRCIDRKNTCHQCFICRELLKLLIAFRCGCEAADVKW